MKKFLLIVSAVAILFAGCKKEEAHVDVTGVTLKPASLKMVAGNTAELIAAVEPKDASNIQVEWTSSNLEIATVDVAGKVTAVAEGSAEITVTTVDGGFQKKCKVTVTGKLKPEITVDPVKMVGKGKEIYLNAAVTPSTLALKYTSMRPDFATVDETGRVHGVDFGEAEILIETDATGEYEKGRASCIVKVMTNEPAFSDLKAYVINETQGGANDGSATLSAKIVNSTAYDIKEVGFKLANVEYPLPTVKTNISSTFTNLLPKSYKWSAYVKLSDGSVYSTEQKSFTVGTGSVVHKAVDLGLTVDWADCNIGANLSYETGLCFSWGEIYGYATPQAKEGGFTTASYQYTPTPIPSELPANADAASKNWGAEWQIPTKAQMQELIDQCVWTWESSYNDSGVSGYLVTGPSGEAIFLPCTGAFADQEPILVDSRGYYWTNSLDTRNNNLAYYLSFTENAIYNVQDINGLQRFYGAAVRPVKK